MAKRIVTAFGSSALEVIENDPAQLSSIKGISTESALKIGEEFRRIAGLRKAVTYFARYGLSSSVVAAAWKKFEMHTIQAVEDNPWCLCVSVLTCHSGKQTGLPGRWITPWTAKSAHSPG